jgi:outer membrane protein, multidrug efflux system
MPLPVLPVQRSSRTALEANRPVNRSAQPRALLAALLALALAGCATPVVTPSVDIPPQFAAASAAEIEPEVAWWDSYGDPVLSDLVRRTARENRDVKIAAERVRAARRIRSVSTGSL